MCGSIVARGDTTPFPEDAMAQLQVLIVEDERYVREGLAALIDTSPGFRCVQACATMEDGLAAVARARPDVVLTDLRLPGMSGIDGIALLHQHDPGLPILALTVFDTDAQVFDAICAGASGYVLKNTVPARLLDALAEVASGGAPMSPEVARRVVRLFRTFQPAPGDRCHLTAQEHALLKLLADGHHRKSAAQELGISINTVSFHLKHLYEKLQVHSKTEAVAKALREHLL
jgi:DNA-binding NarL/FixJ family response regulator